MSIDILFKYYYRPLCLYAIHYLQDVDMAEDIVQDAFVRMIEKEQQGVDIENKKAYLYQTVRHLCIDSLRKASPLTNEVEAHDLSGTISNEEAEERSFDEAMLWTSIDALPQRCRKVFLMSKRDGMKYHEISHELGISEKTVEHQISKALKVLRKKVSDFFYFLFSFA